MASIKALKEQRAPIGVQIRKMADSLTGDKKDFTAEERSKWETLNSDFSDLTRQIDRARADDVDTELRARDPNPPGLEDTPPRGRRSGYGESGPSDEVRAVALQAWCRRQTGLGLSDVHKRACKLVGLNPAARSLEIVLPRRPLARSAGKQSRALSTATGSAGGYTVPSGFMNNLEVALKAYNGVREVADVIRTDDGAELPWPTVNDTGNVGELIGENTETDGQDVAFGRVLFGGYKYSSKLVLVPEELMEDSAFDMADELSNLLGERIGRATAVHNTTGSGSGQPQGLATAAPVGKVTASPTALTADEIIDLIHSVDPSYRRDPSFGVMMHDSILAVVRKLKDGNGRYLFQEATDDAPDRVHGARVVINQNMASAAAASAKTMLAGAFRKYKIRDVNRVRIKRLNERFAERDQVGFVGFLRTDGKLLDAGTNPVKALQQAAA